MDKNFIICPVRGQFSFTYNALYSFLKQDIGNVHVIIMDNSDLNDTLTKAHFDAVEYDNVLYLPNPELENQGVAQSWNICLDIVFNAGWNHALVVNNDVELRPDTYRLLIESRQAFPTAVAVGQPLQAHSAVPDVTRTRPHPDFSCFLMRKTVFKHVGRFDENFKGAFAEDWDYHVRLHKAGITAVSLDLPFYHFGSATVNNSPAPLASKIHSQADKNRRYFAEKWGIQGGSKDYERFFGTLSFMSGTLKQELLEEGVIVND